jgi:hypothetical protein
MGSHGWSAMPRARVNGVVHYEEAGSGPALVSSHEFGGGYRGRGR